MIQLPSIHAEDIPGNKAPGETQNCATLEALQKRCALAYTIGTPEHAALLAAIRREFPEVYGMKTKRTSARESQRIVGLPSLKVAPSLLKLG